MTTATIPNIITRIKSRLFNTQSPSPIVSHNNKPLCLGTDKQLLIMTYHQYIYLLKGGSITQAAGYQSPYTYTTPDLGYTFDFPTPDYETLRLMDISKGNIDIQIDRGDFYPQKQFLQPAQDLLAPYARRVKTVGGNPNKVNEKVTLQIVGQTLVTLPNTSTTCLALVCRCPYSRQTWHVTDLREMDFLVAQIKKHYININYPLTATSGDEQAFWIDVVIIIKQGYTKPAESYFSLEGMTTKFN